MEAGLVATTWAADLTDAADVATVTAHVRSALEAQSATAQETLLQLTDPAATIASVVSPWARISYASVTTRCSTSRSSSSRPAPHRVGRSPRPRPAPPGTHREDRKGRQAFEHDGPAATGE